ncbi:MAG: hypothetical protein ABFS19_09270 [Thermodesulfobacteriota bacterium]
MKSTLKSGEMEKAQKLTLSLLAVSKKSSSYQKRGRKQVLVPINSSGHL